MSNTSSKDSSSTKKKTSSTSHRTSASYEETIVHGKKRKVWRSTASSTANMMSPEAAANYLQQAAEAAAAAASGSGGESVQITLGPNGIAAHTTSVAGMESLHWMNPYAASRSSGTATGGSIPGLMGLGTSPGSINPLSGMGVNMNMSMNMNMNMNLSGGHPPSVSFGNLDLAALARAGDLSALTSASARNVGYSTNTAPFPTSGFGTNILNSTMGSATAGPTPGSFTKNGMTVTPINSSSMPLATSTTMASKLGNSNSASAVAVAGAAGSGKESLPCSEAEMKALMSMFVEIMGMSMDTEKLGKSTAAKKQAAKAKNNGSTSTNLFSFGDDKNGVWPDPAIAAATGDLDALNAHRYAYSDDEEDDDDSLPALDDMNEIKRQGGDKHTAASYMKASKLGDAVSLITSASGATPITGRAGIAPVEWESLEQVAIEDAMEAEERARKAAKRREKKNRKKEKARKEAVAKAAEVASKRREKAILSWRSRVVSACQSNEVDKLIILLDESPLSLANCAAIVDDEDGTPPPAMTMATMTPHLEFLLPHTVAKNWTLAERGNEARTMLANYVMNTNLPLIFTSPLRTGRTAMHTACLYGELSFVEHALHLAQNWTQEEELSTLPASYLSTTCQESGFAPIHYAVLSGSKAVLETILKAGADVKLKSTDTHTWKSRYVRFTCCIAQVILYLGSERLITFLVWCSALAKHWEGYITSGIGRNTFAWITGQSARNSWPGATRSPWALLIFQ
jgi:hypothetical protein